MYTNTLKIHIFSLKTGGFRVGYLDFGTSPFALYLVRLCCMREKHSHNILPLRFQIILYNLINYYFSLATFLKTTGGIRGGY